MFTSAHIHASFGRSALLIAGFTLLCAGCAHQGRKPVPTRVLVVAPVLNLSGSQDFDPLKVTDLLASEFITCQGVAVVPVNLALAELERRGKYSVETPEDARELARVLGADATVVTAITEYRPADPPIVGMTMQWYGLPTVSGATNLNPVAASRAVAGFDLELSDAHSAGPRWQLQRTFNAADEELLEQIRDYARERGGHQSPFGWRKYTKSQELYVRYCGWAMIRTMLRLDVLNRMAVEPHEAEL